jgi:hypothetical protein
MFIEKLLKMLLLFNSRVKLYSHGKLRSMWLGLYLVIDTSTHGAITIQDDEGNMKIFLDNDRAINEDIDMIELVDHEYVLDYGSYRPIPTAGPMYIPSRLPLVLTRKDQGSARSSPVRLNQGWRPSRPILVGQAFDPCCTHAQQPRGFLTRNLGFNHILYNQT